MKRRLKYRKNIKIKGKEGGNERKKDENSYFSVSVKLTNLT